MSRALEAMGLDLSRQEAKGVLMQLDKDGSGALSFRRLSDLLRGFRLTTRVRRSAHVVGLKLQCTYF